MDKRSLVNALALAAAAGLTACANYGGSAPPPSAPPGTKSEYIDEAELRLRLKSLRQQMVALAPYVLEVRADGTIVVTNYVRLVNQGMCPPPGPLPTMTALPVEEALKLARAGVNATPNWGPGDPPAVVKGPMPLC